MVAQGDPVFTDATEALLHQFAYGCYTNGLYEKALRVFRVLTIFRRTDSRYWYGLGACLLATGNDVEATQAFQLAAANNSSDLRPNFFLADCLSRLGRKEEAEATLTSIKIALREKLDTSIQDTPIQNTSVQDTSIQEQIDLIERMLTMEAASCQ